jgi:hypothetical protein
MPKKFAYNFAPFARAILLLSPTFLPTMACAQPDETIVMNCTYAAGGRLIVQLHAKDKSVEVQHIYPTQNVTNKGSITSTTDQEMVWTEDYADTGSHHWTLNRYTGDFTDSSRGPSEGLEFKGSCSRAQKQF